MKNFEEKATANTGAGLFRTAGEISDLESLRVDAPIDVLNTYVGFYEFTNSALKTLQVKLKGNDLEIIGTNEDDDVLFTD